jgi:hypothetical protein
VLGSGVRLCGQAAHPWTSHPEVRAIRSLTYCTLFFGIFAFTFPSLAQVPSEVEVPGTQPHEVPPLQAVVSCSNCHGHYDPQVEPYHTWQGSMMSHATRDPVFWAAVAVAEEDYPGVGNFCIRCHTPTGFLGGRAEPTNGSALLAGPDGDGDGVTCIACHRLTNPDESEFLGTQYPPYMANDGGTPAKAFVGCGEYVLWPGPEMLGPYLDPPAYHGTLQSKLHRQSELCGTCHDISNPVTGDLAPGNGALSPLPAGRFSGVPGGPVSGKAAFLNEPFRFGAVERTFSELKSSAFDGMPVAEFPDLPPEMQQGVLLAAWEAATVADPSGNYEDGTVRTFSCQTCHMMPVTGTGDGIDAGPIRTDLPLHDLTGGNYWAPQAILYLDGKGKLLLGGGMSAEVVTATLDGIERARANLQLAAALSVHGDTVEVLNLTGHRLLTGYPEGRRMWLHTTWRDAAGVVLREDGAYGPIAVSHAGAPLTVETLLDLHDSHTRIYEAKAGITQAWAVKLIALGSPASLVLEYDRTNGQPVTTLGQLAAAPPGSVFESFHLVLNDTFTSDNRIPPYGYRHDDALERNALPVPADQYGNPGPGGIYDHRDEFELTPPAGAATASVELLYQPTSWEYIQFLALANDGQDAQLGATGDDLLEAWLATGMAAPHVMASAEWSAAVPVWEDLGNALAGVAGEPGLSATGELLPGSELTIDLRGAKPSASAVLVAGFGAANIPFHGGVLVPEPQIVVGGLVTRSDGSFTLRARWPANAPSGTVIDVQMLIADAAAPAGIAMSNAMEGTSP